MNKKIKESSVNIGTGVGYTIKEYAKTVLKIINPNKKVKIIFDKSKPNGAPRRILDISLAKKYGWKPLHKLFLLLLIHLPIILILSFWLLLNDELF